MTFTWFPVKATVLFGVLGAEGSGLLWTLWKDHNDDDDDDDDGDNDDGGGDDDDDDDDQDKNDSSSWPT